MVVLSDRKRKFSIAMATYNGGDYLEEQLGSIARQTRKPDELVIFDDGSTDLTLEICRSFAQSAPFRVEITQNKRKLGFADNFISCAEACSGDWIFFCDQDDVWVPNKIEIIEAAINAERDDLVLVFHRAAVVSEDLTPLGYHLPDTNFDVHAPANTKPPFWFVGGCVMCFSSSLLNILPKDDRPIDYHCYGNGSPVRMAHDKWICYLASASGAIGSISDVLIQYRRHKAATTAVSKKRKPLENFLNKFRVDESASIEMERFCCDVSNRFHTIARKLSCRNFEIEAKMYGELANLFSRRATVYSATTYADRLKAFLLIYITSQKSSRVADFFNWRRAIKDVTALALTRWRASGDAN